MRFSSFHEAGCLVLQDARGSSGWEEPKGAKDSCEILTMTVEGRRIIVGSMVRRGIRLRHSHPRRWHYVVLLVS